MLNRMQIEGVVLKTWKYAGTPFARLVNRPDPGMEQEDMLFIVRFPANVPVAIRAGDQLRMHGRFYNRRKEDSDDLIGEIHAEQVVLVARNQLRKPRDHSAGGGDQRQQVSGDEDAIAERRLTARVFVDAEPISGQPDLVYRDRGHVVDYKTCRRLPGTWKTYRCQSCGKVMQEGEKVIRKNLKKYECPHCEHAHDYAARLAGLTEEPPRARPSHVAQINVYTWILAQHGIAIHSGEIIYLDMGGMIRAPVEIWPMTQTAELVEQAYNALLADELPDRITDPDALWECGYCPIRRICEGQKTGLAEAA